MQVVLVADDPVLTGLARAACSAVAPGCSLRVLSGCSEAAGELFCRPPGGHAPPLPALVVLDLTALGASGVELLQRIKTDEELRATPVVVFCQAPSADELRRLYHSGANSCIAKPAAQADLEKVVHRLFLYWTAVNEPPSNRCRLSSRRDA